MEQCWRRLASGRSGRTPNSQGREDGLGWWSWLRRSEVAGQARLHSFCNVWPRLAPSLCRGSFRSVWEPHGFDVGVASWLAAQHVRSRRPSWSAYQPLAPVARFPSANEVFRDARFVCPRFRSPHGAAADVDGVVLQSARRRKERTHPELVGPRSRARLVRDGSWWPLVRRDEIVCVTVG